MDVQKPDSITGSDERLKSGETFPETGYYSYAGHEGSNKENCFVSADSTGGLLFTKGETVPKLVSCPHVIYWQLDARY